MKRFTKHTITTAIYSESNDGESVIGLQKVIEERTTAYCIQLIPASSKYHGIICTQWVGKTPKTIIYNGSIR